MNRSYTEILEEIRASKATQQLRLERQTLRIKGQLEELASQLYALDTALDILGASTPQQPELELVERAR